MPTPKVSHAGVGGRHGVAAAQQPANHASAMGVHRQSVGPSNYAATKLATLDDLGAPVETIEEWHMFSGRGGFNILFFYPHCRVLNCTLQFVFCKFFSS